jgi:hypothetical protein
VRGFIFLEGKIIQKAGLFKHKKKKKKKNTEKGFGKFIDEHVLLLLLLTDINAFSDNKTKQKGSSFTHLLITLFNRHQEVVAFHQQLILSVSNRLYFCRLL